MVEVGQKAPDLTLTSDERKRDTWSEKLGEGLIVLSWYLWDFSSVCTGQACEFRDVFRDFQGAGAKVFEGSADNHQSHPAFLVMHNLPYPLPSDWNKTARAYGVLYDKIWDFEGVSKRAVFVLDRDGIIRYKWITEDPNVPPDAKAAAKEVARLR